MGYLNGLPKYVIPAFMSYLLQQVTGRIFNLKGMI